MGRRVRAGRLIVKRTRVLAPPPGMEPTRGQSQEPQQRTQWNDVTGTIHGSQDPDFVASVGQTLARQGESRASYPRRGRGERVRRASSRVAGAPGLLAGVPMPPGSLRRAYDDLRCVAEPPTGRRARDAEIRGNGQVPGGLDKIPKPVIVALLKAARGRHRDDHRSCADAAQLLEDIAGRPPNVKRSAARQLAPEAAECPWRQLRGLPGTRRHRKKTTTRCELFSNEDWAPMRLRRSSPNLSWREPRRTFSL
jgi:hypothetical protein